MRSTNDETRGGAGDDKYEGGECFLASTLSSTPRHFVRSCTSTSSNPKLGRIIVLFKMNVILLCLVLCWSVAHGHELETQDVVSKIWLQLKPMGELPSLRHGHTAVSVGDKMLVFGGVEGWVGSGKNDLWEYSTKKNTWKQLEPRGRLPAGRYGHTAVSVGDKMLVCGGQKSDGKIATDLWEYSMKRNTWKQLKDLSFAHFLENGGFRHTAVLAGDKMLVYGGTNGRKFSQFMSEYSMKQGVLKTNYDFNAPKRYKHTAVSIGDNMLVFGGETVEGGEQRVLKGDLWKYSIKQNTRHLWWKKSRPSRWKKLTSTGGPSARSRHTAVSVGDKMLVFGGQESHLKIGSGNIGFGMNNDLWEYSMKKNTWKKLVFTGGPSERAGHTAVSIGDNMLVFGGEASNSKKNDLWILRDPCGYGNYWDNIACRSCGEGTYQPSMNSDTVASCVPCSTGKYSAVPPGASCTDCPKETPYSPAGSSSSKQCGIPPDKLMHRVSKAVDDIDRVHKRQGEIIHEVAKADAKADEVRTKAHGNVNKLIRSWVEDDVRKDYEALRQRNANKKEYDETMHCQDEEKDGITLLSTVKLDMDEEVDDTICADKNRDILIGMFCNFRRRLDVVLKDRKTTGKELFPNICCKEDKYGDLVKCQDPTGKVKRHEIIPFALAQGGNFTKVNLYGELVDTLKKGGYLYNGFMKALKLVKGSLTLQVQVQAIRREVIQKFQDTSLCGPRLFTLPRHPEIHLCQMLHPYGKMFEHFLTSFTSLMESSMKTTVPKSERRHLLSSMQGRSQHVRASSPAMAQMLQKKTADQVKRSKLNSVRAEMKTEIKHQVAKQENDGDSSDLVALRAEMKSLISKQVTSQVASRTATLQRQTAALQRQISSLKQQVATYKPKGASPQTCPRITFPTKREYERKKNLFCTGYDKLDLVNENSVNIAVVYAPKVASIVRPKYQVVDEWQDVCASPPLFTPNDISLQQIEGKAVFVVQLDSTSPDGYLRKELPMCGLAVDDKGQRSIPRTKVTVQVFDDREKCCDSTKDNTVCSNNGCTTLIATTKWSRRQLEYSTKITGTTYTLEKEHASRRRRMLQRGSVRGS